jgi:hypothetical protein
MAETGKTTSGLRATFWTLVINVAVVGFLLAALEGASSLLFIANEMFHTAGVPEDQHAEYDEELGWVNLPNVHLPDFYGPGAGVRTNAQRFRSDREFTRDVPPGRTRVVCSGDSFTFGVGVGNQQAWCERLTALDPGLETVNMGLGGYGIDQAYLWYLRDGVHLDHDVHLFAFISDDFDRMRSDRFMGYGRPRLVVRGDELAISNLPVPRTSWLTRRIALHRHTLMRLNMVRLSRKALGLDDSEHPPGDLAGEDERLHEIASRIFSDLARVNESKRSRLVLVLLPSAWDYKNDPGTAAWRRFVQAESERQRIPFVDLVEELRSVAPTEVDGLFAPNAHFSVAGNEWAAEALYARLARIVRSPRPAPGRDDARAAGKTGF